MGGWRWLLGCERCTVELSCSFMKALLRALRMLPLVLQHWLYVLSSLLQPLKCSPSLRRSRLSCRRLGCISDSATGDTFCPRTMLRCYARTSPNTVAKPITHMHIAHPCPFFSLADGVPEAAVVAAGVINPADPVPATIAPPELVTTCPPPPEAVNELAIKTSPAAKGTLLTGQFDG